MIILYRFLLGITCYATTLHAMDLYDPDLDTGDIASHSNDGGDDTDTESADETADTPNEAESDDSGDTDLGSLAKSAEELLKGNDDVDGSDNTESADETADTPNEAETGDSGDADLGSLAKSAEDLLKGSDDDTESAVDSMKKNISALAEREAR